ncbi:MAG: AAA family ATPase [Planctomycetia bacterium]|nr:AAA family ATPase [Planctomycetia bacterium]
MLGGANGSGKSTLANVLLKKYPVEFLNADEIAKEYSVENLPEAVQRLAGREYIKRKKMLFQQNKSFILETTLSGRIILKTLREAKKQGYSIVIVYSFLSNSLACIQRVKKRVANGGHYVPEEDITRRYFRSVVNFWDECRFLCDNWYLFYNGIDYQTKKIACGIAAKSTVEDEVLYRYFISIVESAKEQHDVLNVNE